MYDFQSGTLPLFEFVQQNPTVIEPLLTLQVHLT